MDEGGQGVSGSVSLFDHLSGIMEKPGETIADHALDPAAERVISVENRSGNRGLHLDESILKIVVERD